ncbi:MAG: stage II sporulation protein R [Eubacteriales bacterium]
MDKHINKQHIYQMILSAILGVILTGLIVNGLETNARKQLLATQEALAEEVLRFHVLANSNSDADQTLKLQVKDEILTYMEESLGDEESVLYTKMWAENHKEEIEALSSAIIQQEGYDYSVDVELTKSYFPVKTYGDITFPEGEYEALKIEIGDAEGENWWCCLYPSLCFIDATCGVVSEEGKEDLQKVLTVEEYEMITTTTEFEISWFFF